MTQNSTPAPDDAPLMTPAPAWIAVDWGTTHLRAFAMGTDHVVLAAASSADGMGSLTRDAFEGALLRLITPWLGAATAAAPMDIIACGMVGSRQGWVEAPYLKVPVNPLGSGFAAPACQDPRLNVRVIPGLSQATPADVMRGEETQIAGVLAGLPNFDGVICLPGTHTKWAHISANEVVSFQTAMTGELFGLIAKQSVLRHSLADAGSADWDMPAFETAVTEAMTRPEKLAARLFSLRADGLLNGPNPAAAKARLSGLLIGAELAGAKPYWLGRDIAIVGTAQLARLYETALRAQGLSPRVLDGEGITLAGLIAAYKSIPR